MEKRYNEFSTDMPKNSVDLKEAIDKSKHKCMILLTEKLLFDACEEALVDPDDGKTITNAHIRGMRGGNITVTDVNEQLWAFSTKVTRMLPLVAQQG